MSSFIPNKLEMAGFSCFYDKTVFEFPDKPGLYFVKGSNEFDTDLGGNGCGKSTLFQSLSWVLFGKTTEGLKSNDVCSWGQKKAKVSLSFYCRSDKYTLVRTRNPITLKMSKNDEELMTVTQDQINDLIQLDYEQFTYSLLFGQFNTAFFDLDPSSRLRLFTTILNLSQLDLASEIALDKESETKETLTVKTNKLSRYQGQLDVYKQKTFDEMIANYEEKRVSKIQVLEDKKKSKQKQACLKRIALPHRYIYFGTKCLCC